MKIAFIGLGNMGGQIAGKLTSAGDEVIGVDQSAQARAATRARGIRLALSAVEATVAGEAAGTMLPNNPLKAMSLSLGQYWSVNMNYQISGPQPASPANLDYRPCFVNALTLKDLGVAAQAAASVGADTPLGGDSLRNHDAYADTDNGNRDFSAVIAALRDSAI